nr:hypothetical transcript [Hymenolepis microstoma]
MIESNYNICREKDCKAQLGNKPEQLAYVFIVMGSRTAVETYFRNIRFLRKTVIVKENDITSAFGALNKILRNDRVVNTIKAQEYYEKPTRMRRRVMYERCKRVYDNEMSRKINFVMKADRPDPWIR